MNDRFIRTEMCLGKAACERLNKSRVAVFGVGGVGGYAVEALVRSGVGSIDIIDNDVVSLSNINRQIIALESTLGRPKVEVMAERIAEINPECKVTTYELFFTKETSQEIDFSSFDYVVDAVDTVEAKLEIIERSKSAGVPVITCMGAGNKIDPTMFRITDISKTKVCPLARTMRARLKKMEIENVKAVWSEEQPIKPCESTHKNTGEAQNQRLVGSLAFVPSVAGLIVAAEVVKDLIKGENDG